MPSIIPEGVVLRKVVWPPGHDTVKLQGLPHMGIVDREAYESLRERGVITDECDRILQRSLLFKSSYQTPSIWIGALGTAAYTRYYKRWPPLRSFGVSVLGGAAFGLVATAAYLNEGFRTLRMLDESGIRALEQLGKEEERKLDQLAREGKLTGPPAAILRVGVPAKSEPVQKPPFLFGRQSGKDEKAASEVEEDSDALLRDGTEIQEGDSVARDWNRRVSSWENVRQRRNPDRIGSVNPDVSPKTTSEPVQTSPPDASVSDDRGEEQRRFDELLERERRLGQDGLDKTNEGTW